MKTMGLAIGAGLGYLAGNEQARRKAWELVKQAKGSPPAKAIESKVSDKVTALTPRTSSTSSSSASRETASKSTQSQASPLTGS